jgi:hypothetical protein
LRIRLLNGFEAGEGAIVVEVVEVLVRLANRGGEIDGVGVGGGIVGVRDGRECQQKGDKKEAKNFDTAFDDSSPTPGTIFSLNRTLLF